jgi:hypothetical protein
MKKILIFTLTVFLFANGFTQRLAKLTFADNGNLEVISFELPEAVIINVSKDGSIVKWGVNRYAGREVQIYEDKLDEYTGRVEYYRSTDNEAFRGKIKYIGTTAFTYYASYDIESLRGKLRSIGTTIIDYYQNYEDAAFKGNIKKIGNFDFAWNSSFDNEALKGKLRSVGATNIDYFPSFAEKAFAGKIKSIAGNNFTYFSQFDSKEYPRGKIKTGAQIQYHNGIKYFIRN